MRGLVIIVILIFIVLLLIDNCDSNNGMKLEGFATPVKVKVVAPNAPPKATSYGFSGWIGGCTAYDLKGSGGNTNFVSLFYDGVNPIPIDLGSDTVIDYDFDKNPGIGVQLNLNKLGGSGGTGRCDNVCGIIGFKDGSWDSIGKSGLNRNLCGLKDGPNLPMPPTWDPPISVADSDKTTIVLDISNYLIGKTSGQEFVNARFCSCSGGFPCDNGTTCSSWPNK